MSEQKAESLVAEVESFYKDFYNTKGALAEARYALAKEENLKVKAIEELVRKFAGVELDESDVEDVEDRLRDMASTLDMNTEYMELDLAEGTIDMWQNSYC